MKSGHEMNSMCIGTIFSKVQNSGPEKMRNPMLAVHVLRAALVERVKQWKGYKFRL